MNFTDKWYDSLIRCATDFELFTTDDVMAQYSHTYGEPDSSRPVGGAIVKAMMAGFIEKTSDFREGRTHSKSRASAPKRVYRSRLRANV